MTQKTFWLSFVDKDAEPGHKFLGVSIIDVDEKETEAEKIRLDRDFPAHQPGAEWLGAACAKAWREGCNPGGQVGGVVMPEDQGKEIPRNRLMQTAELKELGLI